MEFPRTFERYESPRTSKLEAHRGEIAEMIRLNWPIRKVVEFLKAEHQLEVACSRVWTFCRSRNIVKGRGEVTASDATQDGNERQPGPDSPSPEPASLPETFVASEDDISGLLERKEEKSPFTKFKPKPQS